MTRKKQYILLLGLIAIGSWLLMAGPFFGPPPQGQQPPIFLSRCEGGKIALDSLLMLDGSISVGEFERRRQIELQFIKDTCGHGSPPPCCPPPVPIDSSDKDDKKDSTPGPGGTDSSCHVKTAYLDRLSILDKWRFLSCNTDGTRRSCPCKNTPETLTETTAQEDTVGKNRFLDIVIGTALKDPYVLDYIPFDYDNHYVEWRDNNFNSQVLNPVGFTCKDGHSLLRHCQNWKNEKKERGQKVAPEWGFLVPSRSSEKVWFVMGGQAKIIPELKASWFDKKEYADLLYQLVVFLIQDPNVRIKPYEGGKKLAIELQGNFKGQDYLIVFSNQGGEYLIAENQERPEVKLNAALLGNLMRRNDKRIRQMVADYVNKGVKQNIQFALPYNSANDPLQAIGNPSAADKMPPNLMQAYTNGSALDFLMSDGIIWRDNEERTPTWYRQKLTNFAVKCPWLPWLAIADPKLEVVAEDTAMFQFVFRNTSNLWTWIPKANGGIVEHKTLEGSGVFLLSGKPVSNYITQLLSSTTMAERSFFIRHADPSSFTLLDEITVTATQKRILLVKDYTKPDRNAIYLVGEGLPGDVPIVFKDVEGNPISDLSSIRTVYQARHQEITDHIINHIQSKPEVWFGPNKLLFVNAGDDGPYISLLVPSPKRSFLSVPYKKIEVMLQSDRGIVFPSDAPAGFREFCNSILRDDWRKSPVRWRANPLGYLDRALNDASY